MPRRRARVLQQSDDLADDVGLCGGDYHKFFV
jgi:hypothetical protein